MGFNTYDFFSSRVGLDFLPKIWPFNSQHLGCYGSTNQSFRAFQPSWMFFFPKLVKSWGIGSTCVLLASFFTSPSLLASWVKRSGLVQGPSLGFLPQGVWTCLTRSMFLHGFQKRIHGNWSHKNQRWTCRKICVSHMDPDPCVQLQYLISYSILPAKGFFSEQIFEKVIFHHSIHCRNISEQTPGTQLGSRVHRVTADYDFSFFETYVTRYLRWDVFSDSDVNVKGNIIQVGDMFDQILIKFTQPYYLIFNMYMILRYMMLLIIYHLLYMLWHWY